MNIGGHINVAGFVATTNQITVEHNASLICTHIDLKGISASSLLKNKGKITSEKLFLTSSIKIRNESGATLSIPSMNKSPNLDVPDLITNAGLIEVKGNLSLMRAGCLGETGVWKVEGKFSILLGENCSIQCKDLHAHTIDINAPAGTVMGGFKAKHITITAAEVHVTHETIAQKKSRLTHINY